MLSANEWAVQQWAPVKLGDRRRTQRAVEIGAKMAEHPESSLPEQMQDPSTLKAAYRLLNDPAVTLGALITPHCQQTRAAAGCTPVVLLVEDTTELDYTHHPSKKGLGPLGNGKQQGLLLHSTLAIVPDTRAVLGLAHQQVVVRQPAPQPRPRYTRSPEAQVWEVAARELGRPPAGAQWVHVGDRASDIFEFMATCRAQGKHFLVRAQHNRLLAWSEEAPPADQAKAQTLLDYARTLPAEVPNAYTVQVPARDHHPARAATLALQWASVTIPPPAEAPPEVRQYGALTVWVVRAWEPDPPLEGEPLEWVLLTSWPVGHLAEAQRPVEWYSCRWICEDYHQCLKTGCRIERSQLDEAADIERLLGFVSLIAVRLLQLRQAARHTPEIPATALVEPLMVRVLATRQEINWQTMTAEQFWRSVARLGGHQGRRRDGPPGWRTVWRGWRYLSDLTEGARLFVSPPPPSPG